MRRLLFGIGCLSAAALVAAPSPRPFNLDDLALVRGVSDPEVSPDGALVAYSVRTTDVKEDKHETHIWRTTWDGKETVRLTTGKESETSPRWSPDGRSLAFLSERGDENDATQLWILPRSGGEAEKLTEVKGDVEDFDWSPDGKRLVLVVDDPDPEAAKDQEGAKKPKTKKPIVIDRFQFKLDGYGYLVERHKHLYLARPRHPQGRAPDGRQLRRTAPVLVARRQDDRLRFQARAGSGPHRQLGRVRDRAARGRRGAQADDLRGLGQRSRVGRQPPRVEPGQQVDRLRAGRTRQAHLLRAAQARDRSGRRGAREGPDTDPRSERSVAALLARRKVDPLHAGRGPGGSPREDRRRRRPGRARRRRPARDLGLFHGRGPHGDPLEHAAGARGGLRRRGGGAAPPLHPERRLARRDPPRGGRGDELQEQGRDRDPRLRRQAAGLPGRPRYPAVLRIHGGPVGQFELGFDEEWQWIAANGYVVVAANPRGSSGRGEGFQTAIYADWGHGTSRTCSARWTTRSRAASSIRSGWRSAAGATAA